MYPALEIATGFVIGFVSDWTGLILPFISILLGISGLYFNLRRISQSKKAIQKKQENAISELRSLIRVPMLSARFTKGLVTSSSVRSNAIVLSSKHNCGEVTIPMMGEAIRWVSLDLQERFSGQQLKKRLEELNSALKELDSSMPALLSLAKSDPLAGYYYGQSYIVVLCAMTAVISSILFAVLDMPFLGLPAIGALLLMAYHTFLITRAKLFFDSLSRMEMNASANSTECEKKTVRAVTDFFLYMFLYPTKTSYFFWNVAFAPLWEQPIMFLRTPGGFAGMHDIRFIAANEVRRRLNKLQSKLVQKALRGGQPSVNERESVCDLLDRLWVITGDDTFKKNKEEWNDGRAFNKVYS